MKKRLACVVCALALLAASLIPTGSAAGYSVVPVTLRILEDNVMLYKNPTDSPADALFALSKGYFASAASYDETYWQITYQQAKNGYVPVVGYLKKQEAVVLYEGAAPDPVYPDFSATALFNNTFLYETVGGTEILGVLVKNQTAKCYGFFPVGEEMFVYAKCGNLFGYLPCANLRLTEIPEHPIPLPKEPEQEDPPPDNPDDPETPAPKDDKLQILLILAIVIPSLVIIYVMLRPRKKRF